MNFQNFFTRQREDPEAPLKAAVKEFELNLEKLIDALPFDQICYKLVGTRAKSEGADTVRRAEKLEQTVLTNEIVGPIYDALLETRSFKAVVGGDETTAMECALEAARAVVNRLVASDRLPATRPRVLASFENPDWHNIKEVREVITAELERWWNTPAGRAIFDPVKAAFYYTGAEPLSDFPPFYSGGIYELIVCAFDYRIAQAKRSLGFKYNTPELERARCCYFEDKALTP